MINPTLIRQKELGSQGLNVSAIGLGCMGMSFAYARADQHEAERTLDKALEMGVNFWDTAEVYGPYSNELLLSKFLKKSRSKIIIASKFAWRFDDQGRCLGLDGGESNMRRAIDGSLQRLAVDCIDLYYLHRLDPNMMIEDVMISMAKLVKEGKVRFLGLSKVGPEIIRRAHSVHPLTAVQNEYSLWERSVENTVLCTLNELGIGLVAYSPLGSGFLTGTIYRNEDIADDDFRKNSSRFQNDNMDKNWQIISKLFSMAKAKGISLPQLALSWLIHKGGNIIPLPGISSVPHLLENIAALQVVFTDNEIADIDQCVAGACFAGERVPGEMLRSLVKGDA